MPDPHGSHRPSIAFDASTLERLACPVCLGALRLATPGLSIVCLGCQTIYPLIDGIPVLIPERAVALENN
jgi:uncharacterized protein YbaR (Trm112 family)